jgi:hypothetical protein
MVSRTLETGILAYLGSSTEIGTLLGVFLSVFRLINDLQYQYSSQGRPHGICPWGLFLCVPCILTGLRVKVPNEPSRKESSAEGKALPVRAGLKEAGCKKESRRTGTG